MSLFSIDKVREIKILKHAVWVFCSIAAIIGVFIFIGYASSMHNAKGTIYEGISGFFIHNPYTTYANPIFILLTQIFIDWIGFMALLCVCVGIFLTYQIEADPNKIPFSIAYICICVMNLLHFLTVQYFIFTKQPFPWDLLTWWENRLFISIALIFPAWFGYFNSKIKSYTNKGITIFSFLFYFLLTFVFVYYGVGMTSDPEMYISDYPPYSFELFIPLICLVFFTLPSFIMFYYRKKSYFSFFLLLSILPLCLGELYTIINPRKQFYSTINLAHTLETFAYILPLFGILFESRILFYKLEDATEKAKDTIEKKNQFMGTLSNQLKTPLNSILGQTQSLYDEYDGPVSESQKASLEAIINSTNKLSYLINEIIDISKFDAGQIAYTPNNIDLIFEAKLCTHALEGKAKEKNLDLTFKTDKESLPLFADPLRLRQTLSQLILNAIKFTESGSVDVEVQESDSSTSISVKDTGCGIPSNSLEKIFEPYTQLSSEKEAPTKEGIGLGLPIAQRIAKSLGGKILVTSEEHKGSTFTLELPKVRSESLTETS